MTDKEFKRLKRSELIEIIYQLQQQSVQQQAEIDNLQEQLSSKQLKIEKAGSIAEAAIGLNEIFEKAQEAADMYLGELQRTNSDTETETEAEKEPEIKCTDAISPAEQKASESVSISQHEFEDIKEPTDPEIDKKRTAFNDKVRQFLKSREELTSLLNDNQ